VTGLPDFTGLSEEAWKLLRRLRDRDQVHVVRPAGTLRRERIVVGFAGGGGSSIAIAEALGVHPDAALNHWDVALGVHAANFPETAHYCADIRETDPNTVCPGERIGLLWLSPDCRHFSKAKGGAPVSPRVRGLAWVAIPWADKRRPRRDHPGERGGVRDLGAARP
jgi:hypothetical protein